MTICVSVLDGKGHNVVWNKIQIEVRIISLCLFDLDLKKTNTEIKDDHFTLGLNDHLAKKTIPRSKVNHSMRGDVQ